jgi:hypothetical protein
MTTIKKINNSQASHFNHKVELQTLNEHPKNSTEEAKKNSGGKWVKL